MNMSDLNIYKNIPITDVGRTGWIDLYNRMDFGDSVLLTKIDAIKFQQSISNLKRRHNRLGGRICIRKDLDDERLARAWKIKCQ